MNASVAQALSRYFPDPVSSFRPLAGRLRSLLLLTISLLFLVPATKAADDKPFDRIISNIIRQELKGINSNSVSAKARSYLRARQGDGSFPDIDYASRSQTNWAPITHLDRTKVMVLAYVDPAGPLYGDKALYAAIVDALDYWHAADPVSTNWYMWEIAWPQRMGVILSLMRAGEKQVPAEVETKILAQMRAISKGPAQPGSQGSGANKMDIALQWIYRAALQRDKEALDFAVEQFYRPMTFNIHEGLQSDYSYLQHGPQLYIGGYGASVLTAMLKVAFYVVGTEYTGGKSIDLISRFVRRAYMPAVRGRYMLYGAIGRGFARKGGIDRAGFAYDLAKMQELDPAFADTYQKGIERMRGREGAGYGLEPYHCHFWRGDYTLHQRPDYTLDVRMASTRTMRCENGNGENLRGYFITEGGTAIVRRGDEYHDIFPVWDWSRLPGTTTPALAEVPRPAAWGQMGQSPFAGGVSDSLYGVTAYQMTDTTNNVHTSAKKAWFFFDNEVVCLGADIRSENAAGIGTTINQCLLNGPVHIQTRRAKAPSIHGKGEKRYADPEWIHHDSVSYYFPAGGDLTVRADTQSGTWNYICSNIKDNTVQTKEVFKAWLDHGTRPQGARYQYCIVPATSSIADARQRLDRLVILNTDSVQAVYNHTLRILGIVFHKPCTLAIDGAKASSTAPCVAMFTHIGQPEMRAYVADPSGATDSLSLSIQLPRTAVRTIRCHLDRSVHRAGSTHAYEIGQ